MRRAQSVVEHDDFSLAPELVESRFKSLISHVKKHVGLKFKKGRTLTAPEDHEISNEEKSSHGSEDIEPNEEKKPRVTFDDLEKLYETAVKKGDEEYYHKS